VDLELSNSQTQHMEPEMKVWSGVDSENAMLLLVYPLVI